MTATPHQIKVTAKTAEGFEAIKKNVDAIDPELVKMFDKVEDGMVGLEFETSQYMFHDHIHFPRTFHIKRVGFRAIEREWSGSNRKMYQVEVYGSFQPDDEDVKPFDAHFRLICLEQNFAVKSF